MKILKTANITKLKMSYSEWTKIGQVSGWSPSPETIEKLEMSKKEALSIAQSIKEKLVALGYNVPNIDNKDKIHISLIKDRNNNVHSVNIELKPWANRNNKKYELRSGIILMAGPYSHKKFKRKRFSLKNVDKMIDYINKIIKYTNNMQKLRENRSKKAEVARSEKYLENHLNS